jgi:hypothetical protein
MNGGERDPQEQFRKDLEVVIGQVRALLIEKNRKYGDAALNPQQTFARCDALELINVRIDDKLNRIKNQQQDDDEDAPRDLLGYLVLREIAKLRKERAK